jgi:hypothetical protein
VNYDNWYVKDLKINDPMVDEKDGAVRDAIGRAHFLSNPDGSRCSGRIYTRKDLMRIIVLAKECRRLKQELINKE